MHSSLIVCVFQQILSFWTEMTCASFCCCWLFSPELAIIKQSLLIGNVYYVWYWNVFEFSERTQCNVIIQILFKQSHMSLGWYFWKGQKNITPNWWLLFWCICNAIFFDLKGKTELHMKDHFFKSCAKDCFMVSILKSELNLIHIWETIWTMK